MAFRADLYFDKSDRKMKFRVLDYHYTMDRPYDSATGQISGRLKAGRMTFTVEIVPGQSLWPYIYTNLVAKQSIVELWGTDKGAGAREESILKTIEMTNAYVVELSENFSSVGGQPATMTFTLSCEKLKEDGAEHENEWSRSAGV